MDHILVRVLDTKVVRWPHETETNPFLAYRSLFHSYHLARAGGMTDKGYRRLVLDLDASVAEIDCRGFRITPFRRAEKLSSRLGFNAMGGVWIKDETGNVSGSHKARHLMAIAIHLRVAEHLGLTQKTSPPMLAIASCGNAALAAAVVARAMGRELEVFVPTDAPIPTITRLEELGARITVCPREPAIRGDPTYHRLRQALAAGALPFTCQGNQNGLVIEGGETLGWEMSIEAPHIDRVVVQVGGGALASSIVQAFREAAQLGSISSPPRIDTVQTRSAFPLKRAYERVVARVRAGQAPIDVLRYAATHRSEFMWPWEETPRSSAHGILDDETYDWLAIVTGMASTGGRALTVGEDLLEEAKIVGHDSTGIDVDHTGSAGLAGLLALAREGTLRPDENVAVLFTAAQR
jgi:threonine synthase